MEGKFNNVIVILRKRLRQARIFVLYPQEFSPNELLNLENLKKISEQNRIIVDEIEEAIAILKREQEKAPQK